MFHIFLILGYIRSFHKLDAAIVSISSILFPFFGPNIAHIVTCLAIPVETCGIPCLACCSGEDIFFHSSTSPRRSKAGSGSFLSRADATYSSATYTVGGGAPSPSHSVTSTVSAAPSLVTACHPSSPSTPNTSSVGPADLAAGSPESSVSLPTEEGAPATSRADYSEIDRCLCSELTEENAKAHDDLSTLRHNVRMCV